MGERKNPGEYDPGTYNLENVVERSQTFLATATSTDAVRAEIKTGKLAQFSSKKVFLSIHKTHILENPDTVYNQEDTPGMNMKINSLMLGKTQEEYLRAGEYRDDPASVGDFHNLPTEEVKRTGDRFFGSVDRLLTNEEFLTNLQTEQKLLIISLLYHELILAHFVRNASGRTDEDFLCYVASRLGVPFTVSESGFRGQMSFDDYETQVEQALWIFRNDVGDVSEKSREILHTLEQLINAAEQQDVSAFDQILLGYEQDTPSVDSLLVNLQDATERTYTPLPKDDETKRLLSEASAHCALIKAQSYDPSSGRAQAVKDYLGWHVQEVEEILQSLDRKKSRRFIDEFKKRCEETRNMILRADQEHAQEEQERLERASEPHEPISDEDMDRLREYLDGEIKARLEAQRIIREAMNNRDRED